MRQDHTPEPQFDLEGAKAVSELDRNFYLEASR
jgi:hypothetical protein